MSFNINFAAVSTILLFLTLRSSNLGFSSSYHEVLKFESSAAVSMRSYLPTEVADSNIQFSADNVDHNLRTIDRYDTFLVTVAAMISSVVYQNFLFCLST
jgi:hypothetical protein